jgi:hypothetical protein
VKPGKLPKNNAGVEIKRDLDRKVLSLFRKDT